MRRARRPRLQGATTKAMPVSIVEAERPRRGGPDRRRLLEPAIDRAPAPPAPAGWWGAKNDANGNEGALKGIQLVESTWKPHQETLPYLRIGVLRTVPRSGPAETGAA